MQNRISVYVLLFAALVFMGACNDGKTKSTTTTRTDSIAKDTLTKVSTTVAESDTTAANEYYKTLFVVVIDTSFEYYSLMREMYSLGTSMYYPVDTLGRYYDKKDRGILFIESENGEGGSVEYYPRRDAGSSLSIEYFSCYSNDTSKKKLALVAGLFETKKSADSLCSIFKTHKPHVFVQRASMWAGCNE